MLPKGSLGRSLVSMAVDVVLLALEKDDTVQSVYHCVRLDAKVSLVVIMLIFDIDLIRVSLSTP